MNLLALASAVLALLMYVPLCYQIWTGKTAQNLATFILWGLLDGIAAGSTIIERGNFMLPVFYTLGATAVIICLIKARCMKWTWLETLISILVVICIAAWKTAGSEMAIVFSSLAMAIASVPQLVDTWMKPRECPILVYVGFVTANFLGIFAGKDWSVAERFYPTVCTVVTVIFVLFAARRWLKSEEPVLAE